MKKEIPENILRKVMELFNNCDYIIELEKSTIIINEKIIKGTLEVLNLSDKKCLPQRSSHESIEKTKNGLDKELKKMLQSNFSFAKYASDALVEKGICKIIYRKYPDSKRELKCTLLLDNWTWN
jgi:hypothetical protein